MKRLMFAAAMTLLFLGCSDSPDQPPLRQHSTAEEYLDDYQFGVADSLFREMATTNQTSPEGATGLARVLERQLLLYDALDAYIRIVSSSPNHIDAQRGLRRVHRYLRNDYEWLGAASAVAGLPGANGLDSLELANAHLALGGKTEAARSIKGVVGSGDNQAVAALVQAQIHFLNMHQDSAAISFDQVESGDKNAEWYSAAADFYQARGLNDSAVAASVLSYESDKDNFDHLFTHFLRCLELGYYYPARQVMTDVQGRDRDSLTTWNLRQMYAWATGHSFMAQQANIKSDQRLGTSVTELVFRIRRSKMIADLATANDDIQSALAVMVRQGFSDKATDIVKNELAMESTDINDDFMGYMRLRMSAANSEWQRDSKVMEVAMLRSGRQFDSAATVIDSILDRFASDPLWQTALGEVHLLKPVPDFEEAALYFSAALRLDPWHRPAFEGQLEARIMQGELAKGLAICDRSPDFEIAFPTVALRKATLLIRSGASTQAGELFAERVGPVAGDTRWFVQFARLCEKQARSELATEVIKLASELRPDLPDHWYIAARFAGDHGDFAQALELSERGLEIEPANVELRTQQARAQYRLGSTEDAIALFETLVKEDYGNIDLNLYYGECLTSDGRDYRRAELVFRQAILFSRGALAPLLGISDMYDRQDQARRVRAEAIRAISVFGEEPEPYFWLGVSSYDAGRDDARESLEKAISLGLFGPDRERAEEILATLKS